MRRLTSIFLLLVLSTLLVPWQELCLAHPFGHQPHPPGEHSACELHKMHRGGAPVWLPPMHCKHVSEVVDNFQLPQTIKANPAPQTLAVAAVQLDFLPFFQECGHEFFRQPDLRCNSGPPISANSLRGPPLV